MVIEYSVDGKHIRFTRNWFTGRAYLSVDGLGRTILSPWNGDTHVSVALKREWAFHVDDHVLRIEKIRPLLFAGCRPHFFRLSVDGQIVVERRGF